MQTVQTTYDVPAISCEHCEKAITEAVGPLDGVDAVDVSIDDKKVTVTGTFDDAAVREAIDDAGYDVA